MFAYDTPLDALGDPTRRRVLELLREGPRSVGELAARLPVSRPAVSQHLAALRRAGLVTYAPDGARHVYAVDRETLARTRAWLDAFWDEALDRYAVAAAAAAAPAAVADPVPRLKDKERKRGKRRKRKKSKKERP